MMRFIVFFFLFLLSFSSAFAQLTANGNTGTSTTAYTNGSANNPIYIWCGAPGSQNGSLTATPTSGSGPFTFRWYYHDQNTSSWQFLTSQTGAASTQTNLATDGYRVEIRDAANTLQNCFTAWVWNLNTAVTASNTPSSCTATNLQSTVSNTSFTYYNPPPPEALITASTTINVCLSASHSYVSDLAFVLIGPPACGNPVVILSPNPGSYGANPGCNAGQNVTNLCFTTTPSANLDICNNPPFTLSGTFSSYGPSSTPINWSNLIGCNAASGGWRVQIFDCMQDDTGILTGASISFSNLTAKCGGPTSFTYNSGTISSPINDISCDVNSASIYQVPASTALSTPITINATTTTQWTSTPSVTITGATSLNASASSLASGVTFKQTATTSYGGAVCSANATTVYNPGALSVSAGPPKLTCFGEQVVLSGSGATTYTWNNGVTNGVPFTPPANTTTTYTVTGTSPGGCQSTATTTVTASGNPSVTGTSTAICGSVPAVATASGGATYTWAPLGGTPASGLSATTGSSVNISQPGSYVVTGFNTAGCSSTYYVFVSNGTPITVTTNDDVICSGDGETNAYLYANSPGSTYQWTPATGLSNPNSSSTIASPATTTTYTVTATSFEGCKATAQATVIVQPKPVLSVNQNYTICEGDTIQLTVTGATDIQWGFSPVGLSSATGNTVYAYPTYSTFYNISGSTNGCNATPTYTYVQVNSKPNIYVDPIYVCTGQTANVFAGGASSYTWSPAPDIIYTPDGSYVQISPEVTTTYIIQGTGYNGCKDTVHRVATVVPYPVVTATATGPVCAGQPITLTGSGATTYYWFGPNLASNTANPVTANPTSASTYTVTGYVHGCASAGSVSITTIPLPAVNTIANQTVCAGNIQPAVTLSSSPAGATFTWTNSNPSIGLAASGNTSIPSFTALNSGSTAVTATITITPLLNGCTGNPYTYTITVNPKPVISPVTPRSVCEGTSIPAAVFTVVPSASTISWTNTNSSIGLAPSGNGNAPAFTATNTSAADITGTITVSAILNGCSAVPVNYLVTVKPAPEMAVHTDTSLCAGTLVNASGFVSDIPGTSYSWTNTNGNTGLAFNGTGNYGTFTALNPGTISEVSTITVSPSFNGCPGVPRTYTLTVRPVPILSSIPDQTVCNGFPVNAVTPVSSVANTNFAWTNTNTSIGLNASGNGIINGFTGINTGSVPQTGMVMVTPQAAGCFGAWVDFDVTVNPTPTVIVSSDTICFGETVTLTASGAQSFSWSPVSGLSATTGPSVTANPTDTTVYTVTGTSSGCSASSDLTVVVRPLPVINPLTSATVCPGVIIAEEILVSTPVGATFNWTNSEALIGLSASGTGNIPEFTSANPGAAPLTGNIAITPVLEGCTGPSADYSITVNPTPVITAPASIDVCIGEIIPEIVYVVNPPSAAAWINDNTAIGLGANGTISIPEFTTMNNTLTDIFSEITVTTSLNGCDAVPVSHIISVHQRPAMESVADITACANVLITPESFQSNIPGTSFEWLNSVPSIGTTGGYGDIPAFTGINTGTTDITGVVTVTPSLGLCPGDDITFNITIKPIPVIAGTIPDQTVCNGEAVAAVIFSSPVAGTTYSWANTNTITGLAVSGNGDIPSFTGTNPGSNPEISNVTVTPEIDGCTNGNNVSFTITVNPTPVITTQLPGTNGSANFIDQCSGTVFAGLSFESAPASTFTWTNSNTAIGLGANGADFIPSFTTTNTTSSTISGIITVIAEANGCMSDSGLSTFTINVPPTPVMDNTQLPPAASTFCAGELVNGSSFGSNPAGSTFAWTNSDPSIGLAAAGTGDYTSFTAINNGLVPVTSTLTVTATLGACAGATETYTITINPAPVITTQLPGTSGSGNETELCSGTDFTGINFESAPASTITWTNSNPDIGLPASGNAAIPPFTATNSTSSTISGTITIYAELDGCSPLAGASSFTISVPPTPVMETGSSQLPPAASTFCAGEPVNGSSFGSNPAGSTFAWTNSDPSIGLAASGTGDYTSFTAINNGLVPVTSTLTVTATLGACAGATETYTITINPVPVVTTVVSDITECSGTQIPGMSFETVPPSAVTWTNSNSGIGLGAGGTTSIPGFTATNTTLLPVSGTISVSAELDGCSSPTTTTFTITVPPTPVMTIPGAVTNCSGNVIPASTFASSPSGATFTWTNSDNTIGLPSTGNGNYTSFIAENFGTAPVTSIVSVAATLGNCTGLSALYTIIVNPQPIVSVSNTGPYCIMDDAQLSAGNFPNAAYSWSGPGFSSTDQNPAINALQQSNAGQYTVTVTANGCSYTTTTDLIINPGIPVTIASAGPFCAGDSDYNFAVNSTGGTWSGQGITDPALGTFDPSAAAVGNNLITYTPVPGCQIAASIPVVVNMMPEILFTGDDLLGCEKHTVNFTDFTNPPNSDLLWDFGDGTTSTQNGSPEHTYNAAGTYTATLTSTAEGCTSTSTSVNSLTIIVTPKVFASFIVDSQEQTTTDPTFNFSNTSSGANTYVWDFGDGSNSDLTDPNHTYPAIPGSYVVTMTANNEGDCPAVYEMIVKVTEDIIYYVPNAFTPNDDQVNGVFRTVFTSGIDLFSFNLLIFNRWGETVFQSSDITDGWDGTYQGQDAPEGTYTWIIEFKAKENDMKYQKQGIVTLLR